MFGFVSLPLSLSETSGASSGASQPAEPPTALTRLAACPGQGKALSHEKDEKMAALKVTAVLCLLCQCLTFQSPSIGTLRLLRALL